jgi:3(or 17)beta-hydroxysteroid dehydrogenase
MQKRVPRVALVTGGAAGLGKAIAQRLATDGVHVVITDVQSQAGASAAAELGCEFLRHDVADEFQWAQVVASIQERHGGLHILVNNAGIVGSIECASPQDTALSDWRRVFAVNVEGAFLGCRTAIPAIHAAGGGCIVNISSIAGLLATPYATAYGASKAALRHLTKSVAQYCMEQGLGIRCNSVHPGVVRTPLWESHIARAAELRGVSLETAMEESAAAIPMGELAKPHDVANAVAFLASDQARHITGAKLIVDGGFVECDTYGRHAHSRARGQRRESLEV